MRADASAYVGQEQVAAALADERAFGVGPGHWALTTWDDVHHASRHPEIFSFRPTSTAINEVPAEVAEFLGLTPSPHGQSPGVRRATNVSIASFFILLTAAGNETTRNAISHGMLALTRYPDERQKWWSDFDRIAAIAVEEIVRWVSPIIFMRRTLTEDTELHGVKMATGDKGTMWYCSANRDEAKFADPWTFDVRRNPNPQLGFGAGGAHFCLGANLARREIAVAFGELSTLVPDIEVAEEPQMLRSVFVHGIKRLPVQWTPPN